jgi:hypothetical protein
LKNRAAIFIRPVLIILICVCSGCAGNTSINSHDDSISKDSGTYKKLVTLKPTPHLTQKFLLAVPAKPEGIVVLLPGGHGKINLTESFGYPIINDYRKNFIVRTYQQYLGSGFVVALIDCPEEFKRDGFHWVLRGGKAHEKCISAVIDHCRNLFDIPVWLVGTSSSTASVAFLGVSLRKKVDGLVFTSSLTHMKAKKFSLPENGILDCGLLMVDDPVFVAAHEKDACEATPASKSHMFKERLTNSPRVEIKIYSGGLPPRSGACDALSPHGFYGIENAVVGDIIQFIKTNTPSK